MMRFFERSVMPYNKVQTWIILSPSQHFKSFFLVPLAEYSTFAFKCIVKILLRKILCAVGSLQLR